MEIKDPRVLYPEIKMLIGGEWRGEPNGAVVLNPENENELARLPKASVADLDDALAAADAGFTLWRDTAPAARSKIINIAARLLRERIDQIAVALTLEQGKPIAESRTEILRAAEIIEWDAAEGLRTYGRVIPSEPGMRHTVVREPIGPVVAFSPWNFPISAPSRKIAGALASGCSIIIKPAEETPAGCFLLVKAFVDAGVPAGVLNLVYGQPDVISAHLIPSPIIRLLTFTGSVPVGKHLAALAGADMKPAIMELGGHCPVIVCDDVDPEDAADASLLTKARNAGQVCVSPTRFFVQAAIYDRYVARFGARAKALKQGDGMDASNDLGPLANLRRVEAISGLVEDAIAKGARLAAGGVRPQRKGFYYPMTVLADVPDGARAMHEEPFGPLALIQRFETVHEALDKANSLPFALAAYAFTHSADRVARISDRIECGNLSINHFVASLAETPFGGLKDSGYGREGGTEGLSAYTTVKNISLKTWPLTR